MSDKKSIKKVKEYLLDEYKLYLDIGLENPEIEYSEWVDRKKKNAEELLKYRKNINKHEWKIIEHLLEFYEHATTDNYNSKETEACVSLGEVLCAYRKFTEYRNGKVKNPQKNLLNRNFGLSMKFIDNLYNSWFCKLYQIQKGEFCKNSIQQPSCIEIEKKPIVPPQTIIGVPRKDSIIKELIIEKRESDSKSRNQIIDQKPVPIENRIRINLGSDGTIISTPKTSIFVSGNQTDTLIAQSPIIILKQLIDFQMLTDYVLTEFKYADERTLSFFERFGIGYEITFQDLLKTIRFPTGEYTIRNFDNLEFWDRYQKTVEAFKKTVLRIIRHFGGDNFIIVTQGLADKPLFKPKQLKEGFDTTEYSKMRITYPAVDSIVIKEHQLHKDEYSNDDLPNLRGTFLKMALKNLSLSTDYDNKIYVLNGKVIPITNEDLRNGSILIYINWDAAERYFQDNRFNIFTKGEVEKFFKD